MLQRAVSGQWIGFCAISAFSGTALTGLSGLLSGWKSVNGTAQKGISGNIVETAFGQYIANLFDWDVSGNSISYLFTGASGMITVEKTVITCEATSGHLVLASGSIVSGIIASGIVFPTSGANVVVASGAVYPASGSVFLASGSVTSGTVTSGSIFIASGPFVNATATVGSGSLYLASGSIFINTFASGAVGGGSGNLPSAWGGSGAVTVGQDLDKSGITASLLSGQVWLASGSITSGLIASGTVFIASGPNVVVPIASVSGLNAVVPIVSISGATVVESSGTTFLASGSITSGVIASGVYVSVPSASISGTFASVPIASVSGINAVVPISSISGTVANSGLFVSVPSATISGVNAIVPPANLSGVTVTANVTLWQGVAPNALISSGRLDAAFNVRTNVAVSGTATTIQLDAGVATGISGVYDGAVITLVGGTGAGRSRTIRNMGSSGIATVFPAWDASGVPDTTTIFTLTPGAQNFSGSIFIASGSITSGLIASGIIFIASGATVVVPPATLSGVSVNVPLASVSGINVVVPVATLSGVVANSGLFVSVPIASISGATVIESSGTLYPASGSVFLASGSVTSGLIASGIVFPTSGANVVVASGTIFLGSGSITSGLIASGTVFIASGPNVVANATIASGSLYLASGSIFNTTFASGVIGGGSGNLPSAWGGSGAVVVGQNIDKSGYTLHSSGLDAIVIESGMNARQALAITAASAAGQLSGAGTPTMNIQAANNSGQIRLVAKCDASGNRTTVTLTLP